MPRRTNRGTADERLNSTQASPNVPTDCHLDDARCALVTPGQENAGRGGKNGQFHVMVNHSLPLRLCVNPWMVNGGARGFISGLISGR